MSLFIFKMSKSDNVLVLTSYKQRKRLSNTDRISIGFIAGSISKTLVSPLDVLKTLIQVSPERRSTASVVKSLWEEDGVKGFWRGNLAGVAKLLPQATIKYFLFEELKKRSERNDEPISDGKRALIGATASVASQLLTYPFDVIRTRMIVNPSQYKGIFQSIFKITNDEGYFGLYSGVSTIIGSVPYELSQYYINKMITQHNETDTSNPLKQVLTGATSCLFSQTIAYPFDIVRKRLMLNDPKYHGMINTFKVIIKEEGISGLYKGIGLNLVKIVPYAVAQYALIDELRGAYLRLRKSQ